GMYLIISGRRPARRCHLVSRCSNQPSFGDHGSPGTLADTPSLRSGTVLANHLNKVPISTILATHLRDWPERSIACNSKLAWRSGSSLLFKAILPRPGFFFPRLQIQRVKGLGA